MVALHGGSRDKLESCPNLWAGVGLVRGGAGTVLVGSHSEVARGHLPRPFRAAAEDRGVPTLGVEHFALSAYPHLGRRTGSARG
ncbi:hypothetical protein GCM10023084_46770 [Streptomyces lacrimifluminis]